MIAPPLSEKGLQPLIEMLRQWNGIRMPLMRRRSLP